MIPEGTIINCSSCMSDMYKLSTDVDENDIISASSLTRICEDLPDLEDAVSGEDIPSCPYCDTPLIWVDK
tara:strand:- start:347 stop:556 length:210 start_codon:yes stop_codon:yes gene_type:complete